MQGLLLLQLNWHPNPTSNIRYRNFTHLANYRPKKRYSDRSSFALKECGNFGLIMGKVEVTLCIVLRFLTMVTRSRWLQLTIKICIFMVGVKIKCIYFQPPWLWVANICPLSKLGFLGIVRNGWGSLLEKAQLHINSNLMLFPSQVQALQTNINLLNFIFIGEMSQGEREVITFSSGKQDFLDWGFLKPC